MTNQTVKNNRITALYLRLSQEDEREGESNSIANQRDILTRYAQINGFPIPGLCRVCLPKNCLTFWNTPLTATQEKRNV